VTEEGEGACGAQNRACEVTDPIQDESPEHPEDHAHGGILTRSVLQAAHKRRLNKEWEFADDSLPPPAPKATLKEMQGRHEERRGLDKPAGATVTNYNGNAPALPSSLQVEQRSAQTIYRATPQQQQQRPSSPPKQQQQRPSPPSQPQQHGGMNSIQVQVPAGVRPGQQFMAITPDGKNFPVIAPTNAVPGMTLQVSIEKRVSSELLLDTTAQKAIVFLSCTFLTLIATAFAYSRCYAVSAVEDKIPLLSGITTP